MVAPLQDTRLFYLPDYLAGETVISGRFEARFGKLTRAFTGRAMGRWQGDQLVLDETFQFDDGRSEDRSWRLLFDALGNFTSTCPDVVGSGIGRASGESCLHDYLFRLAFGRRKTTVRIRETYSAADSGEMIYDATLFKFGLNIGTLHMRFARPASVSDLHRGHR